MPMISEEYEALSSNEQFLVHKVAAESFDLAEAYKVNLPLAHTNYVAKDTAELELIKFLAKWVAKHRMR